MSVMDLQADNKNSVKGSTFYAAKIALIAAVGGFLFGYDTAVISGAIPFLEDFFKLSSAQLGFAVSSVVLGCIIGSSVAGSLADKLGRKKIMISASMLFLISAILTSIPNKLFLFDLARFVTGLAIGLSSPISPLYIAEMSPAKIRGGLVTLNQLAITFGIVAAYLVDWGIAMIGDTQWQTNHAWRYMFASAAIPALILIVGLGFIPESPRWLIKEGHVEKAKNILIKIGGMPHAEAELSEIKNALGEEKANLTQLLKPGFRWALLIGILIMVFSQITGMNAIYMYTSKLLLKVGFATKSSALFGMVIVGLVNFLSTIFAISVIDKVGRRFLMLIAPAGMCVCMIIVAIGFGGNAFTPAIMLAAILIFVFFFAIGVGPEAWLVTSEIFPNKVRGRAMSICTFSLWMSSFVANLVFPKFLEWSQTGTFCLFAAACALMVIFVYKLVPETKGKTLEEIENFWKNYEK